MIFITLTYVLNGHFRYFILPRVNKKCRGIVFYYNEYPKDENKTYYNWKANKHAPS